MERLIQLDNLNRQEALRYLGVFFELVLQIHLHQPANESNANKNNPLKSYYHILSYLIVIYVLSYK